MKLPERAWGDLLPGRQQDLILVAQVRLQRNRIGA